jgi:glycosyltransferase involved in cell wall biosynthesis
MADEVVIICPELSPGSGGVGDYTLRVVEEWQAVSPRFLVANATREISDNRVEQLDAQARLVRELPGDAKVLVQYSAYGFHRFGYPRALLRAVREWKRGSRGVLVVMFHEIWTFWPIFNKNYPLQWLHRRDIGELVRVADEVFTSTASQAEHLRSASTRADVKVLPVGSNIRPPAMAQPAREAGRAVLFGLQASRVKTLQKLLADLRSLVGARVITRLVTVGGGNTALGDRDERALLAELQLSNSAAIRGALPEDELSHLLARSSFALSAQDELSVTKSGTFVAYAAHGLNIISPHAAATAREPLCWATHPRELLEDVGPGELAIRAGKLRDWHERTCSWPRIAAEFARALQLPMSNPAASAAPL